MCTVHTCTGYGMGLSVSHQLLTSPMWGRGSSTHCVCVCVCVTTLANATSPLKAKVRYQQKAFDVGNKINIGIKLKILSSKVVTGINLPRTLHSALMPGNRRQPVTGSLQSLDWTGGLTFFALKITFMLLKQTHLPA